MDGVGMSSVIRAVLSFSYREQFFPLTIVTVDVKKLLQFQATVPSTP